MVDHQDAKGSLNKDWSQARFEEAQRFIEKVGVALRYLK
jgi:hypothetical protein